MKRIRHVVLSIFLVLALVAPSARAEVVRILDQHFPNDIAAGNNPSRATELGSTDWWRIYSTPTVHTEDPDSATNNVALRLRSAQGGAYIVSPPVSGTFGKLSFRALVVPTIATTPPPMTNDPILSVALTPAYDYRNVTTWPNSGKGEEEITIIDLDMSMTNQWKWYSYTFNREVADAKRVLLGRMRDDRGWDVIVDDIVLEESSISGRSRSTSSLFPSSI